MKIYIYTAEMSAELCSLAEFDYWKAFQPIDNVRHVQERLDDAVMVVYNVCCISKFI